MKEKACQRRDQPNRARTTPADRRGTMTTIVSKVKRQLLTIWKDGK
jgi:hypothetical protein